MHVCIIRAVQQSIILLFTYLTFIQVFVHYRSYKQESTLANDCCFFVTATSLLAINIPLLHRPNNVVMVKKLERTLAQQRIYRSQRGWHSSRSFTGFEQMVGANEKGNFVWLSERWNACTV